MKHFLYLIAFSSVLASCSLIKTIHYIKNEDVKTVHHQFGEKEIIFVPMVHFGQEEFYKGVKDSIISWKKQGYVVYYEEIITDTLKMGIDSVELSVLGMKIRRIMGSMPTREEYAKELSTIFKNGVPQPDNKDMGIDSTDLNADITLKELIGETERRYGEIILDSCDYATPMDSTYECHSKWKMKKIEPIILDYRNEYVVGLIKKSSKKKFIVVYGANHIKGMKKLMDETAL